MTKSIPALKLQAEQLRAREARQQYEAALAKTVLRDDLIASGLLLRGVVDAAFGRFVSDLSARVVGAGAPSLEVEVHHALSDAMVTALRELDNEVVALPMDDPIREAFRHGAQPKPLLTVSEWAEQHRVLKSGTNLPGPWRNANNPHLIELMDDFSVHSPVEQITFVKSSGVGGTEALYNMLGYVMGHVGNKDVMVVVPTLDLRDRSLNPRIDRLINETPTLSHINTRTTRDAANRGDLLEYSAVGRLIKTGANSDEAARMDHVQYLLGDEVASWKSSKTEGDRLKLFKNRLRTATRGKICLVSTPVHLEDYVWVEFLAGNQSYRHVPCPHCGEYQTLELLDANYQTHPAFRFETEEDAGGKTVVTTAWYVCQHNGCIIEEPEKRAMLPAGKWVPTYPERTKHHSYQINALYIPYGMGWTWVKIAQEYVDAQNDTEALTTFVQTTAGLPYEEKGDGVEAGPLMLRREDYGEAEPWLITTAFVDVQKDRLECGTEGWLGHVRSEYDDNGTKIERVTLENWKLDYFILPGDTADEVVWDELAETLKPLNLNKVGIDSGYNTGMVYQFCQKHGYAVATKGIAGARPLIEDARKRRQRLRIKRKKGVPVEPLGVDQGKSMVYNLLKNTEPGAGFVHFRDDPAFDEEYFMQLTAEALVAKKRGGRTVYEWKLMRARNEALDIAVGNLAMIKLLNVQWSSQRQPAKEKTTNTIKTAPRKPNPFARRG